MRQIWIAAIKGTMVLVAVVSAGAIFTPGAQAEPRVVASPSMVTIAVDITNKWHPCTLLLTRSTSETTSERCPAGTVIGLAEVPMAQAISDHDPYVAVSPLTPMSEQSRSTLQTLMETASNRIHQQQPSNPMPSISCGSTGNIQASWWYDLNDAFSGTINYYKTLDCQTVTLQVAYLKGLTSPQYANPGCCQWEYDKYGGGQWWVPGAPWVEPGSFEHTVDSGGHMVGLYYEEFLNGGFGYEDVNIGPVK